MKLQYPYTEQNLLSENRNLNLENVNRIISQLIANDMQIYSPADISPKIWECKWYNDDKIEGYPEGYAVWLNTEDPYEFISFNKNKIYDYAKNNATLRNKISVLNADSYSLYNSILTGYVDSKTGEKLPPLFEIGQLSGHALIKVSRIPNNKKSVYDTTAWKDFMIYDNYLSARIMTDMILQSRISSHIDKYHFGKDHDTVTKHDISSTYMLKDLSNLDKLQKYYSHTDNFSSSGLSYVVKYVKKPSTFTVRNKVIKSVSTNTYWRYINYDSVVDENGYIKKEIKQKYKTMLQKCNNYTDDQLDKVVDNLKDKAIVNIEYSSSDENQINAQNVFTYDEIADTNDTYDCNYTILPLITHDQKIAEDYLDLYEEMTEETFEYYDRIDFTYFNWFRLWSNGCLEHGGIVPVEKNRIVVKFDWQYSTTGSPLDKKTAEIYNYPESDNSFYGSHKTISKASNTIYDRKGNLPKNNRYVVSLTPITTTLKTSLLGDGRLYPAEINSAGAFIINEIDAIRNDGFEIYVDVPKDVNYYSYHVTGYRTI